MSVIGVIPARWGSTRLPGKSLTPLCKRPLVAWVVENAARCRCFRELVLATDDARIAAAVAGLPVRVVMTDPALPSGTDRVAAAIAGLGDEAVVNIQGDEPLVDPALLERLARVVDEPGCDMATAVARIEDEAMLQRPSVVKVVCDKAGRALYFSRSVIPHVRDAAGGMLRAGLHWRHIGVYAYRRAFLERLVATPPCALEEAEKLEQLRALHLGGTIRVIETVDQGIGVDTADDVAYVEAELRKRFPACDV